MTSRTLSTLLCPLLLQLAAAIPGCDRARQTPAVAPASDRLSSARKALVRPAEQGEGKLKNIRQLTFEGENAEAYFSADGKQLIFQSRETSSSDEEIQVCDQIYRMNADGTDIQMVSTGEGRTTCAYFLPGHSRIIYSSTHLAGERCPEPPENPGRRYVWPVYKSYDIFSANPDGSDLLRLTDTDGYDAEATASPDGSLIVFTSARDGDLELYTMRPDGSDQRRVTKILGYDGGAFFSPDGKMLCFRASRPKTEEEENQYRQLLARGLVEPSELEIFVADADGSNIRQVTGIKAASFCPFFHPSGKKIIFSTNYHNEGPIKRNFDLFMVDLDGRNLERITYEPSFDGFPMFSPDGKNLVWCGNRFAAKRGDTNIFIADWVE